MYHNHIFSLILGSQSYINAVWLWLRGKKCSVLLGVSTDYMLTFPKVVFLMLYVIFFFLVILVRKNGHSMKIAFRVPQVIVGGDASNQ